MKKTLLTLMLLAGGTAFAQVSIGVGIRIGPPPPARIIAVRPVAPGPEFVWVEGYWYPVGNHYKWHSGYWTRPPYPGAAWVVPRHDGQMFYQGYWQDDRGRYPHDHGWDRDRHVRDYDRDHDHRWHDHDDHDRH